MTLVDLPEPPRRASTIDPLSSFVNRMAGRVQERFMGDEPGFAALSTAEKQLYTTLVFDAQVYSCGFDFYLQQVNHRHHGFVLQTLEAVGCPELAGLLRQAVTVSNVAVEGPAPTPFDSGDEAKELHKLQELDEAYAVLVCDLPQRLWRFAREADLLRSRGYSQKQHTPVTGLS